MKPSAVVARVEAAIGALSATLSADKYEDFLPVYEAGDDGVDAIARDRVYAVTLASGPMHDAVTSCMRTAEVVVVVRYYDRRDSRIRAWDDAPWVTDAILGATGDGVTRCVITDGPRYTYDSDIAGAVVVSWVARVAYMGDI
jgi:hypothetical protein